MNSPITVGNAHIPHLQDVPLDEQIALVESCIRAQPTTATHRWALFQLMCVTGEWARAVQQLQMWAQLEPDQASTAQAYRDLIRAERRRSQVVAGQACPGFVVEPASWVRELVEALRLEAHSRGEFADEAREKALDASPLTSARTPQGIAAWISDSDSRFGPVCEVLTAGHYRWVPFADLAAWRVPPPTKLIDLIWAPCVLTLIDRSVVRGFMPARYPGSDTATDALRLGRETVWHESGRATVVALGQKTWATDLGDFGLFELADTEFDTTLGESVDG